MRVSLVAALALSLTASAALAQTSKYETLPAGFETTAASSYSYILGAYPDVRFQFLDGTSTGKARIYTEVAYRLDPGRYYNAYYGTGRTWSRMTLDMNETDLMNISRTFATNRKFAGSCVYDGKMTWPTVSTGTVTTAPWNVNAVTFSKPWLYTGKHDMMFEYVFENGSMANGISWPKNTARFYFMDSQLSQTSLTGAGAYHPASGTCNDSAWTHSSRAYSYAYAAKYAWDPLVPNYLWDVMVIVHASYNTAPEAPVIQFNGYAGSATGVDIGGACHNLHVDLNTITSFTIRKTSSTGYSSYVRDDGLYYLPYYPPWANVTLWNQAAWTDSKTKAFSLTTARSYKIPPNTKLTPLAKRNNFSRTPSNLTSEYWTGSTVWQTTPRMTYK